jgi:hypothetical protein
VRELVAEVDVWFKKDKLLYEDLLDMFLLTFISSVAESSRLLQVVKRVYLSCFL